MWLQLFLVGLACSTSFAVWHEDVGPWFNATKGEPLPRAQIRSVSRYSLFIRPLTFQFRISGESCDIVEDAIDRYRSILLKDAQIAMKFAIPERRLHFIQDQMLTRELVALNIDLLNPCQKYPYFGMNENYTLSISQESRTGVLRASEVWGILRGLETFSQLVAATPLDGCLVIKGQEIEDSPKFPHRGLLLDTSRHYFPESDILLILDGMSYNKMNVFHWHIVDDNSFPYVSKNFPKLSQMGAYHPTMIYTPTNVRKIVEYARVRGIRVLPEFDTPAHTKSWGVAFPEALTTCYENGQPNGKLGPLNPLKNDTWNILNNLFAEVFQAFPDRYFHLGGDEILFDCWASNPEIMDFMKNHSYDTDFKKLEKYYFEKLLKMPRKQNITSIVWQEVYENVPDLDVETVVQVWTGAWQNLVEELTTKNHSVILSACWYLDHVQGGGDWIKYYQCNPRNFTGTPEMKSRVIGGEACMWGEFVDRTNVHQRIWPRASAAAERLWSHGVDNIKRMAERLEEHSCRMNRRGIPAQPPNGSGFCAV